MQINNDSIDFDITNASYYEKKRIRAVLNTYKKVDTIENFAYVESLINEIKDIARDCCEHNWDCYDGYPITFVAVENAIKFISRLTKDNFLPKPEVMPLASGGIGFEWITDEGRYPVIFHGNGNCASVLFNTNTHEFLHNTWHENLTESFITDTIRNIQNWYAKQEFEKVSKIKIGE